MSKEALARAAQSTNLEMESGVVHDADRLAAMASGDTLGGLLLRYRDSDQPQWARRIVLLLSHRITDKYPMPRATAIKVAVAALEEFKDPHCATCNGARSVLVGQLKVVCHACNGSGTRRYTNASRRERIGTYGRLIELAMADVHRHMATSLSAFMSHAAGRLA